VIVDFDDSCWPHVDADWQRSLIELLMIVKRSEAHAVLASPGGLLPWCDSHLPLFADYFRVRLASAQPRTNAIKILVHPNGAPQPAGNPPWTLTAEAAASVLSRPLRVVLENDESDRLFLTSTIPSFFVWCKRGWIESVMGGGSAMTPKIASAATDTLARWRTFFIFDSDRLHPSELAVGWTPPRGDGCQGYVFETSCASMPRDRWHRLERRAIENYLPPSILHAIEANLSAALFSPDVGSMAHFYNMKQGLQGDGVSPSEPSQAVRATRNQGFWTSLPQTAVSTLEPGFGRKVSDEFANVPAHYPWPHSVIAEINALTDALQDAM